MENHMKYLRFFRRYRAEIKPFPQKTVAPKFSPEKPLQKKQRFNGFLRIKITLFLIQNSYFMVQ